MDFLDGDAAGPWVRRGAHRLNDGLVLTYEGTVEMHTLILGQILTGLSAIH